MSREALQRLCNDWPVRVSFPYLIWPDHRRGFAGMKLPPIVLFAGATLLPFGLLRLEVFARGPFGLFAPVVLTVVAGDGSACGTMGRAKMTLGRAAERSLFNRL